MRTVLSILLFFPLLFLFASDAHAIVVIPALILIPIAKILAVIVGSFALPVVGIGALVGKIKGNSVAKGIVLGIIALLLLAVIVGIVLVIQNPERPLI